MNLFLRVFPIILLLSAMASCKPTPHRTALSTETTYTNPVGQDLLMGDPFVLQHEGHYYLFGTTDQNEGFRCYKSENLAEWTEVGFAFKPGTDSWSTPPYWAPEVEFFNGKFYMTYSAGQRGSGRLLTALAVSDRPQGPYKDLYAPWFDAGYSAIDAHIFIDDDKKPYVFFSRNGMQDGYSYGKIYGASLKADLSGLATEPILLMEAEQEWERINYANNRCNEGPFILKQDGLYYMTYSANHTYKKGYGIGFATAENPLGPWSKSPNNPIAGSDLSAGYSGAGHSSITASPDGTEHFIVYHAHEDPAHPENQRRTVNIDRLIIANGKVKVLGPTRSPQALPSGYAIPLGH